VQQNPAEARTEKRGGISTLEGPPEGKKRGKEGGASPSASELSIHTKGERAKGSGGFRFQQSVRDFLFHGGEKTFLKEGGKVGE